MRDRTRSPIAIMFAKACLKHAYEPDVPVDVTSQHIAITTPPALRHQILMKLIEELLAAGRGDLALNLGKSKLLQFIRKNP